MDDEMFSNALQQVRILQTSDGQTWLSRGLSKPMECSYSEYFTYLTFYCAENAKLTWHLDSITTEVP